MIAGPRVVRLAARRTTTCTVGYDRARSVLNSYSQGMGLRQGLCAGDSSEILPRRGAYSPPSSHPTFFFFLIALSYIIQYFFRLEFMRAGLAIWDMPTYRNRTVMISFFEGHLEATMTQFNFTNFPILTFPTNTTRYKHQ